MKFNFGNWDKNHTVILIGSTIGGALLAYFQGQPASSLVEAMSSWQTAKPLLIGAACAAVTALVALAKQTFLVTPASGGGRGSIVPMPVPTPKITDKPEPPAAAYVSLVWARRVMVCFALATVTVVTGCGSWIQSVLSNPQAVITSFAQYVQAFIVTATTVWNALAPLLGTSTAQGTAEFNAAIDSVNAALSVAEDAIQTAVALNQPNIDLGAVFKPVQDAVQHVLDTVAKWKQAVNQAPPSASFADANDRLQHQAAQIKAWKH